MLDITVVQREEKKEEANDKRQQRGVCFACMRMDDSMCACAPAMSTA